MTTRLGLYGGPSSLYGGFAPKTEGAGLPKEQVTRLGLYGGARQLYEDFSPKIEGAGLPKGRVTRLGLYGGARQLYGLFGGKAEVVPVLDLKSYTHDSFRELIMQEDEELLIIARAFIEILRCR